MAHSSLAPPNVFEHSGEGAGVGFAAGINVKGADGFVDHLQVQGAAIVGDGHGENGADDDLA